MDIQFRNVTVDYGSKRGAVLDGLDLTVDAGEQVALLGASGSGKTTLLRVVLGAVPPAAGQVRVGGLDPFGSRSQATRIRRQTGMVRQRDDLVGGLNAWTNILMGEAYRWHTADWYAVLRRAFPKRYLQRLSELAARHDIDSLLNTRVEQLSGGQRQRVALVRALLPGPRLLLADESTVGLDPVRAAVALAHLRDARGATLLVATHDLGVARQFPRVVALRDGHIVFDGPFLDDRAVESIYGPMLTEVAG
jgi:ABC-type phosphate/phosphonate transport system ATPase subunit